MKLSLRWGSSIGAAPLLALVALTGCSGSSNTPIGDSPDGGGGGPGAASDPPHALGTITLGEAHVAGGTSSPIVAASFVPDSSMSKSCTTTIAGCQIPMIPTCDGRSGPACKMDEICTLDSSCAATCQKPCSMTCPTGQECYYPTPTVQACRMIETFDAGALAFSGTTTPLTLYPPYSIAGEGAGAPFLAGASIEVQGSGATVAGFDRFDETFKATTFIQTVPSLSSLSSTQIWGAGSIPVGWLPGSDSILVGVTGALGAASCPADDASGHFDIPRQVVTAVTGAAGASSLSISVTRQRVETKKDAKTKGTLSTATVQPVGFLQLTTSSTESASFAGCGAGYAMCAQGCVDVTSSATDCGSCGHACPSGEYCSGGVCYGTSNGCSAGYTLCGGVCVNTSTSPTNCGYCGNVCASGSTCSAGQCTGSSSTCSQCESSAESGTCAKQYTACVNDSQCSSFTSCYQSCSSTDTTCKSSCINAYPTGASEAQSLQSCLCNTACSSVCSGDATCTN
jgi:hypothetical protein